MFLVNSMGSGERPAQQEQANKRHKREGQDVSRQIDNLDFRLRQLEGDKLAFFLRVDKSPGLVQALKAAEDHYKARAPAKGQPHPDHNKKATIMAALMNWVATQDYRQIQGESQAEAQRINVILKTMQKPELTVQLEALKAVIGSFQTPLQMEREVATCSFFAAKKDPNKLVLTFALLPHALTQPLTPLIAFAVEAAGGEPAPGAPPKGALFK